jgi:hypothetical protein
LAGGADLSIADEGFRVAASTFAERVGSHPIWPQRACDCGAPCDLARLAAGAVEAFVQVWPGLPGRPPCDRAALARAFVAKAVIGLCPHVWQRSKATTPHYYRKFRDFSFSGASSPEELFAAAATLGISALGIVDRNSLAGIVRAHEAAKATGIRLIVGCRLDLQCGTSLLVYPTDRLAYARLCRLLTLGKTRAGKGQCHLDWPDVEEWSAGLQVILLPDEVKNDLPGELSRLRRIFGERAYCALSRRFLPDEAHRLKNIASAAAQARVPTIVTNDVLYHCPSRRMLQDVVTCIRLHTTIDNAGFRHDSTPCVAGPAELPVRILQV